MTFVPDPDYQVPAVKVQIAKTTGGSGISAPVRTYFASVLGVDTMEAQAASVAIIDTKCPGPIGVPPGDCFPMATPETWVKQNWDKVPPVTFRIGSSYHDPDGGQWTSFLVDANNVPIIRELIDNGNPTPLLIGDHIWIEPGTKTTLFEYASSQIGQTVLMPVVRDDYNTHNWTPILAFVAFYIQARQGEAISTSKAILSKTILWTTALQVPPPTPNYGAYIVQGKMVQ